MTQPQPSTPAPPPAQRPVASVLFYAVAVMVVAQSCLFTILPPVGREIGLSEMQIGIIMSIHGVFMLFAGPWWGGVSETAGRRKVLLTGTVIYALMTLLFGVIIDTALRGWVSAGMAMVGLVAVRSIFAIGAGAVMPASMALAADVSTREERLKAMSLLATAMSIGAILGPGAPALFAGFGLAAPFYFIGALGLLAAIVSRATLPRVLAAVTAKPPSFRQMLRGRVLAIAISSWLFMTGNYAIFAILGFFAQDQFKLSPVDAARWMGVGLVIASLSSVASQTLIVRRLRVGTKIMVGIGAPLAMAGLALVWQSETIWIFILAVSINAVGQSFVNPAFTTALSLSVGAAGQGRLAGLSTSMQALAFLIGPFSGALLYGLNRALPLYAGLSLILAAVVLIVTLPKAPPPIE